MRIRRSFQDTKQIMEKEKGNFLENQNIDPELAVAGKALSRVSS